MTRKERRKRWFDSGGGDLGWTEESESYWRQLGRMDAIWWLDVVMDPFLQQERGELSVPTVGIEHGMRRILKMTGSSHLVKQVPVCEDNSTKCCHHCGEIMRILRTRSGKECMRYRLCTKCGPKTNGKRRHRDVNAARNILMLLELMILGLPRPEHLTCSWRRMKTIVGLPQFVKTACGSTVPF